MLINQTKIDTALAWIKKNWTKLPSSHPYDYKTNGPVCVWFVDDHYNEDYSTDHELVGLTEGGRLMWAYGSGCSCFDGDYEHKEIHDQRDLKTFEFNHESLKNSGWEEKLIEFVEEQKLKLK